MKKEKLLLVGFIGMLVFVNLVSAHCGNETICTESFSEAEDIITQKVSCNDLTESQLEILGDYYMEQMHPGELHEIMDERMGGEGSETLRQIHVNMGLAFYCGEHDEFSVNMMNTMMGRTGYGYGMMSSYYDYKTNYFAWVFNILLIIGLVLLIVWLWNQIQNSGRRK
ncbi:hypothetical protein HYT25_00370 [Candidatus Pacearchaeota archaeon]|nr:hypothetical protein [Candidatus Pacearchaeota archaeon]